MDEAKDIVEKLRHIIINYNCGLLRCLREEDARAMLGAKNLIEKLLREKEAARG